MSLVVPLPRDKVTTENGDFIVVSFTNLKDKPSIYVRSLHGNEASLLHFDEIIKIRGVRVEYQDDSKIFKAYGTVRRVYHLPQVGDNVDVAMRGHESLSKIVVVKEHKLHNKNVGLAKGLAICSDEECFTLDDIFNINYSDGGKRFNRDNFLKYYSEYAPFDFKA